jgi:copper(I)-binding protein
MMRRIAGLIVLACVAAIASPSWAHDYRVGALRIVHPYATATPPGLASAAAYLAIENRGRQPDRLLSASSTIAAKTELHDMSLEGGVMRMRPLSGIDIAPGDTLILAPGQGYHLMLNGLKAPLRSGDRFVLRLVFERAGHADVSAWVQTPEQGSAATDAHLHH